MTKLQRKITATVAAIALVASSTVGSAVAMTSLEISGNGPDSVSDINFDSSRDTVVTQNNSSYVNNSIKVRSSSGSNTASRNVGGDVEIDTGDAVSVVDVRNMLNSNHAEVDCCETGDTQVKIDGNGDNSTNKAKLDKSDETLLVQENAAFVRNNVDADASSGSNRAERNAGGDVVVRTGDAGMAVTLETVANNNTARVGRNNGDSGSLSLRISGNASDSDNDIDLELDRDTEVWQTNRSFVSNNVGADLVTGRNTASRNVGGEVYVDTGDAIGYVDVYNALNFNTADVDCGCMLSDVHAKISGNGYDSNNRIAATLAEDLRLHQHNSDKTRNLVDMGLETGRNNASSNVGEGDSDPAIWTGNAYGDVIVENLGNSNSFGQSTGHPSGVSIPTGYGFNLNLNIDMEALLLALGISL